MGKEIKIVQISEEYIESFHACFDSVARKRVYLGRIKARPLEEVAAFTKKEYCQKEYSPGSLVER